MKAQDKLFFSFHGMPLLAQLFWFAYHRSKKAGLAFLMLFSLLNLLLLIPLLSFAAIPETITYQGTLRKSGAIHTGTIAMEFKIVSQDGSATYWTSGSTNVAVSAGLFRYPLGTPNEAVFQAIDWSAIDPYVEVTIDGITLPRAPLYSSPYSLHSKTSEGRITGTLNANIAGIGTSSPQSKLHVLDGDIRISTTAGSRGIIFQDGSVQNTASGSTQWAASGANLYNTNAGNLGIGTSAPGQKLEVIGTAKATAFQGDGSAVTNITASNITGGSFANAAYTFPNNITVSGSLGASLNAGGFKITNIGAPGSANEAATKGYVDTLTGGGLSAAVLSATQTFTGQDTFLNQIIVSSHLFVTAGNAGIGTAAPSNKLHVQGAGGGSAGIYLNDAVPYVPSYTLYNNAGTLTWNGTALATGSSVTGTPGRISKFTGPNSLGDSLFAETAGAVTLLSNATMTVTGAEFSVGTSTFVVKAGNVGIGTASPGAKLDVRDGDIHLTAAGVTTGWTHGSTAYGIDTNTFGSLQTDSATDGGLRVWGVSETAGQRPLLLSGVFGNSNPTDTVPGITIAAGKNDGAGGTTVLAAAETVLRVDNWGTAGLMTILGNGNVGIGTTSPAYKLDIDAGGGANIAIRSSGSIILAGDNAIFGLWNTANVDMRLKIKSDGNMDLLNDNGTTEIVTFLQSGNVGIGTTGPNDMFDVAGYIRSSHVNPVVRFRETDETNKNWQLVGVGGNLRIENASDDFATTNTRVQINNDGNVGIGNSAPAARLHVSSANAVSADTLFMVSSGTAAGQELLVVKGDGKVGIGTTSPSNPLQVNGNANNRYAATILQAGGTGGGGISGGLYVQTANATQVNSNDSVLSLMSNGGSNLVAVFQNSGNVGIGTTSPAAKIDVAGGVKVANDTGVCNALKAGTIRWTGSAFQGCDGVTWSTFLGPKDGTSQQQAGRTCKTILDNGYSTGSGVYWIDPDNDGSVGNAFQAYCDMVNQDGGWTLVAGIDGANTNHQNTAAVTPANLTSPTGKGKYSDATINQIKLGANPAYRFTCASVTGYFQTSCAFDATTDAGGACAAEAYGYPPGSYGTAQSSQGNCRALADGTSTPNNRLIYGYVSQNGCDTAPSGWGQSGTVYVR